MKIEKDVEARISDYIRRLLVSSKEGGDRSGYNECALPSISHLPLT